MQNFSVLRGELPLSPTLAGGDFVSAEATNTRLMGVVGVHIVRNNEAGDYHQLYYLDFEEYGFDDYRSFQLSDHGQARTDSSDTYSKTNNSHEEDDSPFSTYSEVKDNIADMFGGLGGECIELTERQAVYIIGEAAKLNTKYDSEFPEGIEEYMAVLDSPIIMDAKEKKELWSKICTKPENDYEIINYFVMRVAAMDEDGYRYLSPPEDSFELFKMSEPGTLYRNETKELNQGKNSLSSIHEYKVTSLISDDTGYRLIVSKVSVSGPWVVGFELAEDMRISPWESSIILANDEYVSVSKINGDPVALTVSVATLNISIKKVFETAEHHTHPKGNLFMILRKDNKYAANRVYRLDDDVLVSIFIAHNGEIIIFGNNIQEVHHHEGALKEFQRHFGLKLSEVGRFAFPEATVGYYVKDEFGTYDTFLEFIQFLSGKKD